MKWWSYIKYAGYLAWHWNPKLALFVTWHEIKGEQQYKSHTVGIDDLKDSLTPSDWLHANYYQPVNFFTAEKLMDQLSTADRLSTFLDAGCGKGRMLAVAAKYGFQRIAGFDLSEKMVAAAIQNKLSLQPHYPSAAFHIQMAHAKTFEIPPEVGVIFLFNPFDNTVMRPFVQQVLRSLHMHPRAMKILYANPVCISTWVEAGFEEIFHFKKLQYLEGSVLVYVPKKNG
jgi:SAM-dependent methyltransferase